MTLQWLASSQMVKELPLDFVDARDVMCSDLEPPPNQSRKKLELELDFHRHAHCCLTPLNIQGKNVEMVASYTVSTWVVTLITNWTRLIIQLHYARRARAGSTF